jgi:hypothetical protein
MSDRLMIFVKAPRPGQVKTRLAQALGAEAASAVYRHLVERLLERLNGLWPVELCFTPEDARSEIEPWLRTGWTARAQSPGDLGRRLSVAFEAAFDQGVTRAVVIGSDCVEVEPHDIHLAWAELDAHDLVVGPAQDGGYWLIALRHPQPLLFEGIPWSTSRVLATTLARARSLRLPVKLLRTLGDIDTLEDWQRYVSRTGQFDEILRERRLAP